jgi:hypothetical protein
MHLYVIGYLLIEFPEDMSFDVKKDQLLQENKYNIRVL